jgi:two-component system cell cycle sensor histidine kinase/response regulator CckA
MNKPCHGGVKPQSRTLPLVARRIPQRIPEEVSVAGLSRQPIVVDLNTVVSESEQVLSRILGERIRLRCDLSASDCAVPAYPWELELLLVELALNARDAMPAGGRLMISTRRLDITEQARPDEHGLSAGPYVVLRVADTGVGMAPEVAARAFEAHYTTGASKGLGLAAVHQTAARFGGTVRLATRPGRGAIFSIFLPMREALTATNDGARTELPIAS